MLYFTAGWQRLLLGFSPYTNLSSFAAQPKSTEGHLTSLNGIRFLSMSWVVICHTISDVSTLFPVINLDWLFTDVRCETNFIYRKTSISL